MPYSKHHSSAARYLLRFVIKPLALVRRQGILKLQRVEDRTPISVFIWMLRSRPANREANVPKNVKNVERCIWPCELSLVSQ